MSSSTKYYFAVESFNSTDRAYNDNNGALYNFTTAEKVELYLNISNKEKYVNNNKYLIRGEATPNSKLVFSINKRMPSVIEETGLSYLRVNESGRFSGTIRLVDGFNNITIEVTDNQGNRAKFKHYVTLDWRRPIITLQEIKTPRNNRTVPIIGSLNEDGSLKLNVVYKNQTIQSQEINIVNKTFNSSIKLTKDGEYLLNLTASDLAGNNATIIKKIVLDTKKPRLDIKTNLKQEFHFPVVDIEGKTEPNSRVWIINAGNNSKIVVNITQYDERYRTIEGGFNFDVLAPFIKYSKEIKADSEGKFKEQILLAEGKNELIFKVVDEAGNKGMDVRRTVRMKSGSNKWKVGRISTVPNEVYTSSLKVGETPISVIFELYYLAGSSTDIKNLVPRNILVRKDEGNRRANNSFISKIDEASIWYVEEENKFVGYAKIWLKQYTDDPYKLPDQLNFDLEAILSYRVGNFRQIERAFFKTAVSVQKPIQYSKWLTPKRINKTIEKLDTWIKRLDKAINYAEKATVATTAACVGAIIGRYLGLVDENTVFWICDRVGCPPVPPDCESMGEIINEKYYRTTLEDGSELTVEFLGDAKKVKGADCPSGQNVIKTYYHSPTGAPITAVTQTALAVPTKNIYFKTGDVSAVSSQYLCTNMSETEFKNNPPIIGTPGLCYNPVEDKTKCLDPALRGVNPFQDIITSTRCVCFTGMWGNLENIQKILYGMKKCLQQAQIGKVRGGYCERLFAQFACDIIQWGLRFILGPTKISKTGRAPDVTGIKKNIQELNSKLRRRYEGALVTRFGLSSDQLVRKACVGAITGDWSSLREEIRSKIKAPVAPVIGPLIPESRIVGYNPFTGELTIQYLMTIGIMSGGQEVRAKLNLYCEPGENDDYCPKDRVLQLYDQPVTFYVPRNGAIQRNYVVNVDHSRYWFNRAKLVVEYKLGAEEKTEILDEPIAQKGGLVVQCHWQVIPPMIVCEKIGEELYGTLQLVKAERSPMVSTYYPDNSLNVKVNLAKIGGFDFDKRNAYLYWKLIKPAGAVPAVETGEIKIKPFEDVTTISYNILDFIQKLSAIERVGRTKFPDKVELKENQPIYIVAKIGADENAERKKITVLNIWGKNESDGKVKLECNETENMEWSCTSTQKVHSLEMSVAVKTEQSTGIYYRINSKDFKKLFDVTVPSKDLGKRFVTGNYQLIVDLYEDVNRDGKIDPEYDKNIVYEAKNQTKVLRPTFKYVDGKASCEARPIVDIVKPTQGTYFNESESEINKIIVNVWDDCNKIGEISVRGVDKFGKECVSSGSLENIDISECEPGEVVIKVKAKDENTWGPEAEVKIVKKGKLE